MGTANASLVVPSDDYLTSSDQISSPSNNPYWTGGFRPQVVAAVNLTKNTVGYDWTKAPNDGGNIYNNGAAMAGKTINGIGFTDIVLMENPDIKDQYGQSAVSNQVMYGVPVTNGEASGITMDYNHGQGVFYGRNLACAGWPASVGGASIGPVTDVSWWGHTHMGGGDATNTFDMAWSTISGSSKWFIFHGLKPSNEVLVQLIAGQHGWNQTAVVRLNGVLKDANWQSAKTYQNTGEDNRTDYGAGLVIVAGTADSSGDLTVSVDVGGEFAMSAIIVQQRVEAATQLLVTLPGEAFASGVGNSGMVSGQTAGVSFNITLSAVMADGVTLDTAYSGPKTVAYSGPGTPSGGAAPTYATNVTFSGGQAALLATTLTKAESVKITPAISGLTGLQSSSVTVSPSVGAAERLAFITSPSGGVTNVPWAEQPVVALEDAEGNTVVGVSQDVTLAIQYNAGDGTLSGTKTMSVDTNTGLAIFGGLSINKTGVGYTLAATGSTVSNPVISDTFDITDAARTATRLLITLPGQTFVSGTGNTNFPNAQYAGVPFDIVLTAVDDALERCTSYSNLTTVTYSGPGNAPGGAAPTYTTNVTFVGGRAASLSTILTLAEYTRITPSVAGLTGVTSSVVRVNPGAASKLAYQVVPSNGVAGMAFSVTVRSLDDNGNPASPVTDTLITLSVATGAGSLSGTLAGPIPSGANIVTFSAPVYSEAGTMTMTASGIGMTPITSGNIVFSAMRPNGTIRVSFDYMAEGRDIDVPAYFPSNGFDGGAPAVAAGFVIDEKNTWTAYDVRGWDLGGRSGYYFKSGMSAPVAGANGGSFYDSRSGELTGIKMVSLDGPSNGGPNPSGMSDLEKLNENFAYQPAGDIQLSGLAPSTEYQIWMYGGGGTTKNGPFADTRWSVDGGATWSALVDGHSSADDGRGVMVYFKSSATGTASIKQDGENWSSNRDGSGADPANHSTYTPGFMLQKKPPRVSGALLLIR